MADASFHDFVRELFAGVGRVEVKRMFGGAGAWSDGVMFLLISDDTIHIKVDDALKAELRAEGCGPFVWQPQSGPRAGEKIDLGYWRLPDSALDDPDEAAVWGRKALVVAKAKAKAKAKKPKAAKAPAKKAKAKAKASPKRKAKR